MFSPRIRFMLPIFRFLLLTGSYKSSHILCIYLSLLSRRLTVMGSSTTPSLTGTSIILDIYEKWGLDVMAQVDLDKRIHRNQDTRALGKMSFAILQTFIRRKRKLGLVDFTEDLFDEIGAGRGKVMK